MSARHACSPLEALLVDSAFDADVYPDEPMRRHTMYRIGGPARFYVQVGSIGALKRLVAACQECAIPWVAVGRGSQPARLRRGLPGRRHRPRARFPRMPLRRGNLQLHRGRRACRCQALCRRRSAASLSGLEFAVGTPGTVGGAVRMNAGTREQGIADRVVSVTTLSPRSGLVRREAADIQWGYRSSSFAPDEVIVECELAVKPADPYLLRGKMEAPPTPVARRRNRSRFRAAAACSRIPKGRLRASSSSRWGLKESALAARRYPRFTRTSS